MRSAAAIRCATDEMKNDWDVEAAIATYNVDGWGTGYFTVNADGNVEAGRCRKTAAPSTFSKS